MAWFLLIIAGMLETSWVVVLKAGQNTERHWPKILALAISAMSILLMELAMRKIPMGMAYAVWTGIGAIGATILGILVFGEPFQWSRIFFVLLIVSGLVGLKLSAPEQIAVPPPPQASQEG